MINHNISIIKQLIYIVSNFYYTIKNYYKITSSNTEISATQYDNNCHLNSNGTNLGKGHKRNLDEKKKKRKER